MRDDERADQEIEKKLLQLRENEKLFCEISKTAMYVMQDRTKRMLMNL